jgi:hypothetical protein
VVVVGATPSRRRDASCARWDNSGAVGPTDSGWRDEAGTVATDEVADVAAPARCPLTT